MSKPIYGPGDKVEKFTGDYSWEGIVCGIATLPDENGTIWDSGEIRYLVAHKAPRGWVLHVYAEKNLRFINVKDLPVSLETH